MPYDPLAASFDPQTPECECWDPLVGEGRPIPLRCSPCVAALTYRHAATGHMGDEVRRAAMRARLVVDRHPDVEPEYPVLAELLLAALLRDLDERRDALAAVALVRAAFAAQVRPDTRGRPVLRVVRP